MINESQLLQEKPKPRHNEAESHQGQPRANPGEKRSLGCQVIAKVSSLPYFCG
jgi:hypothetical protein